MFRSLAGQRFTSRDDKPYCAVSQGAIQLQCTATHCNEPHRTAPHHTAPQYTASHRTAPHCTLHCTAPHCTSTFVRTVSGSCSPSVAPPAANPSLVSPAQLEMIPPWHEKHYGHGISTVPDMRLPSPSACTACYYLCCA